MLTSSHPRCEGRTEDAQGPGRGAPGDRVGAEAIFSPTTLLPRHMPGGGGPWLCPLLYPPFQQQEGNTQRPHLRDTPVSVYL